jgi:hypothetical protein
MGYSLETRAIEGLSAKRTILDVASNGFRKS